MRGTLYEMDSILKSYKKVDFILCKGEFRMKRIPQETLRSDEADLDAIILTQLQHLSKSQLLEELAKFDEEQLRAILLPVFVQKMDDYFLH